MMLVLQFFFFSEDFSEVVAELQSRGDKTDILEPLSKLMVRLSKGAIDYNEWMSSSSTAEPESSGGDDDLVSSCTHPVLLVYLRG